ncbi:1-acyl-sn-glycerol-3-phosphate acyltransferase [Methylomarinovum caldicuralii]|uniref:1-acyl-sn-glycerol-3-phosphate acyltransferase n=1 Tax=Methylomarinovum caldicuralii TaxID=438856 RepID=A0AAU9CRX0_9GAMM|nr:lysophospholipid acyltransferase family protein [Methylomarinovum caldicuralii]BCX82718.1 1-acyl-sn-glycerol-3-phosphate acyltransferase [Methylomarinovum caldicuralii]
MRKGPTPLILLRSALFLLVQTTITVVLTPIVLAVSALPRYEYRYHLARFWANSILTALRWICGIDWDIRGLENIPRRNGIVLSKHQSAWETLMLFLLFPKAVFVLKQELLKIPFFGWCLARYHHIAIDRSKPKKAMVALMKQGLQRLEEGHWIIIFPEGTRVAPGERRRYAGSGGVLAARAKVPVVPVAHNAGEYWPRNSFVKYPGTITLVIGPVLDGAELPADEINRRAETWIEATMAKISRP